MARHLACMGILIGLVLQIGCETYRAMPLDPPSVRAALAVPTDQALQLRASQIHHPLLKPLVLHPELGMAPDDAAVLAVLLNPSLRAARDQHLAAGAALLTAGLLPNPQFSYSYDFVTGGNTQGAFNAYGWGLNYDITSLLAHDANVRAAQSSSASIDLAVAWQEWQTAEAAKIAVYDLVSLKAQLGVAEEIDQRLQDNLKLVQRAADSGLNTAIDLSAAETAARDARAMVLQSRRDVEHQQLALNRAIGLPPATPVRLRDGLALASSFDLPPADAATDVENTRLDLLALRRGYDSQEQTIRAAIINQIPKVNIGFNRSNDNSGVHSIGPAITIDLPVFNRNQGVIATEKATRQRLHDEFVGRVFDARADIAAAIADITALNSQIADAQAAIPSLKKLVESYKQAMDHGNVDVLSYYTAWNNLAQKNMALLKLQQQLADTRVALELATGRYFPDTTPAQPATQAAPDRSKDVP